MKNKDVTSDHGQEGNTSRRWLLVDDNPTFLMMLAAVAENFTQGPIECHGCPESALAAFIAAPQQYEVVITDYEMPGINGVELCRRLRALSPGQKIILATGSGYFSDCAAENLGFDALLHKPFPICSLQEALVRAGVECGNLAVR
jgi:CheY-like chemotaxis protein